jgi:carboxyl-terminal processing protease
MEKETVNNSSKNRVFIYLPIILSLAIIIGIGIGYLFSFKNDTGKTILSQDKNGKIEKVLEYIEQHYVDKISSDSLADLTLSTLLSNLDPHSEYIPASELQAVNEPLEGNFDGIGVEFNILRDTITVVNPISGGPSEKVGIKAGDKIIFVNNEKVAGVKISNQQVFKKLRGERDTKVKVKIKRGNNSQLTEFTITRGEIPIFSIDAAYMINASIGYIKINRFSANTYKEYLDAFNKLKKLGLKKLIIDVRGNGGGYLNAAVDIIDELLPKGTRIVYTEGQASPRKDYKATDKGGFENESVVVLIDEGSASASEILAGAIQDNDRGVIIGRRSFGKGLVQEQMEMPDGSALRLTTARYYTPTGRCIQKSYSNGKEKYYEEEYNRFENGELLSVDSIKFADSLKFKTPSGKIVYGGGGIMPDVFVGLDTTFRSAWLNKIVYSGIISDFALNYVNENREQLIESYTSKKFQTDFVVNKVVFDEFLKFCELSKIKTETSGLKKSENYIKTQLKAIMSRYLFGNENYYQISQENDKVILKAIELLNKK